MSLLVVPQQRPEDFKDKMDAPHAEFYQSWGAQLGAPLTRVTDEISSNLVMRFGLSTLAQQFTLTTDQFEEQVLLQSGLPVRTTEAATGWRMTIERLLLERTFVSPNNAVTDKSKPSSHPKDHTVSAQMSTNELDEVFIDLTNIKGLSTNAPLVNAITDHDIKLVLDRGVECLIADHGTLKSIGAAVINRVGLQMDATFPMKESRGVKDGNLRFFRNTRGPKGPVKGMLQNRINNMLKQGAEDVYGKRKISVNAVDVCEKMLVSDEKVHVPKYIKIDHDAAEKKFKPPEERRPPLADKSNESAPRVLPTTELASDGVNFMPPAAATTASDSMPPPAAFNSVPTVAPNGMPIATAVFPYDQYSGMQMNPFSFAPQMMHAPAVRMNLKIMFRN